MTKNKFAQFFWDTVYCMLAKRIWLQHFWFFDQHCSERQNDFFDRYDTPATAHSVEASQGLIWVYPQCAISEKRNTLMLLPQRETNLDDSQSFSNSLTIIYSTDTSTTTTACAYNTVVVVSLPVQHIQWQTWNCLVVSDRQQGSFL